MRSATSEWLPTSAVPAPPRTSPTPAHRLGAISRSAADPPCSARIRRWPSDSLSASAAWTLAMRAGSSAASSDRACDQAASAVSRVMTCNRMPKRSGRPRAAASPRTQAIFSRTWSGGSPQVR